MLRQPRRRASRRANGKEGFRGDYVTGDRPAGIRQIGGGVTNWRMRIRADQIRCAGGAVLRRLEVTEEVVMLEIRGQQKRGVGSDQDDGAQSPAGSSVELRHLSTMIRRPNGVNNRRRVVR